MHSHPKANKMLRKAQSVWSALLVLLASLGFATACDDHTDLLDDGEPVRVTLTVCTGSSDAATRATYTDTPGEGYENYINPDNLRVYLFSGNSSTNNGSTYVDKLTVEAVVQSASNPQLYYVTGTFDASSKVKSLTAFKVVVLANWYVATDGSMNSGTTIDGLTIWNGAFPCTQPFIPSAATPIPMFGIKMFTYFKFTTERDNDFGTIDVVRSVAKIVVKSQDISLADVTLSRTYNYGHSAPYGMYQYTSISGDANINMPRDRVGFGIGGYQLLTDVAFTRVERDDYRSYYVIYVPEYRNFGSFASSYGTSTYGSTPTPAIINFKLKEKDCIVEFKNYQEDTPLNILRNYTYDFQVETATLFYCITSMSEHTAGEIVFD
jgi:hypothetical protein